MVQPVLQVLQQLGVDFAGRGGTVVVEALGERRHLLGEGPMLILVPVEGDKLEEGRDFKFAPVDEDGDVLLSVEYRMDNLDPSEVRDAVDVLAFYADKYHAEVQGLSGM